MTRVNPNQPHTLVVGIGNAFRCEDAAGLLAARLLVKKIPKDVKVIEREGDGTGMIAEWQGFARVIAVDALDVDRQAGEVLRFDVSEDPLPLRTSRASTHSMSLGETIELARTLGELPKRMIVYGIVCRNFRMGSDICPAVQRGIKTACSRIMKELKTGGA